MDIRPFPNLMRLIVAAFVIAGLTPGGASVRIASAQPAANGEPQTEPSQQTDGDQPTVAGENELPKLDELPIPTLEQLLSEPPVDWIVVRFADRVMIVDPVYPRPDTVAKMQTKIDESRNWPAPPSSEERDKQREEKLLLRKLDIIFADDPEQTLYRIDIKDIREIIHHEDLMLRRADLLMDESNLADAFNLVYRLDRRVPDWPGLEQRKNRLVFVDAQLKLKAGELEAALILSEELHGRDRSYPGLHQLLGETVDRLVGTAVQEQDYLQARHFISRLGSKEPDHPVRAKWTERLLEMTRERLREAEDASLSGQHDVAAELVEQATQIWPKTPELRNLHTRLTRRFQTLKVGVLQFPGDPTPYFLPTRGDMRAQQLTEINLFEVDHIDDVPHYRTRYFEQWEPTDLGRQMSFTLRPDRLPWESRPVVTASNVISTLAVRLDPSHPGYDERLDSYMESLNVESPYRFQVRFSRVPLRPEALFTFPVQTLSPLVELAAADEDTQPVSAGVDGAGPDQVLTTRFIRHAQDSQRLAYRRAIPEPDGLGEYHVAEVVEIRYPSHDHARQALLRGEVSYLPAIRPSDAPFYQSDQRFFVVPYALPTTHVLQFNPHSEPLKHRELRRALAYSVDRTRLLEERVLGEPGSTNGRVITGPFPTASYAYNSLVPQREYDLLQGYALAAATRKVVGDELPRLKMLVPPDSTVRAAAAEMVEQWSAIGVDVEIVSDVSPATGPPPDWDIVYRTYRMQEPLTQLWPLLTFETSARVESLAYLPDWLRQQLIALDNAGDWNTAISLIKKLHRQIWSEVSLIPLWEVDEVLVMRKNIRGFPGRPISEYQGIDGWIVGSWYMTEDP